MAAARPGHRKSHSTSALSFIASSNSSSSSGSGSSGSASSAISAAAKRRHRASQHPALGRVEERDGPSRSGSRRDIATEGRDALEGSASMVELPGLTRSRSTRNVDPPSRRGSANEGSTSGNMEDEIISKKVTLPEEPASRVDNTSRASVGGQDELEIRLAKALGDRAKRQTEEAKDKNGLQRAKSRKSVVREGTEDDVRTWTRELLSLRSSDRRRREALKGLERTLIACCARGPGSSEDGGMDIALLVALQVHDSLITLLTRHAQTLGRHRVSLSPGDETAALLCPEISSIVDMLQGLALLSKECKASLGQFWIMEIVIDLLLLLRSQPAIPPLVSAEGIEARPIAYCILDLLCCVLVDSPANARTFEELSGLEAVTRVLKAEKTARDVKMKCLEFLYFYLLPEGSKPTRVVSSSSTSSSSSTESHLYPGEPFTPVFTSDSDGRTTPTIIPASRFHDLDIPFVPQTPQHPARHALGFPTPNHSRRISGSLGATPSLAPVPGSPVINSPRGKSRPLEADRPSSRTDRPVSRNSDVSTGSRDERRWSAVDLPHTGSHGLGFGLTKSTSVVNIADRRNGAISPSDPFLADSRSSSGSSTAKPPNTSMGSNTPTSSSIASDAPLPARMSRSSTQPNFGAEIKVDSANVTARRPSIKRAQKSSTPSVPSSTSSTDSPRRAMAQSRATEAAGGGDAPRPPRIRHSRTQSHLSGLDRQSMPPPTSIPPRKSSGEMDPVRRPSLTSTTTPDGHPMLKSSALLSAPSDQSTSSGDAHKPAEPRPSPAKRAFPSGMTKGLPPSISTPNLSNLARLSTSSQSGSSTPGLVPPSTTSTPSGANLSGTSSTPGGANLSARTSTPAGANLSASSASVSSANTSLSSGVFSPAISDRAGMPLGAVRRVPSTSDRRPRSKEDRAENKGVRSVEEKKALLGSWLGNVDALVENVEKVGFLGHRSAQRG